MRGCHLMRVDNNYEYAHTMFAECVAHDPGNLAYVEALLHNLRLIHPAPQRRSLLGARTNRALKQATDRKDFSKAFQVGIESLKANPWDKVTLRALAEACSQLHFNDVELAYLKQCLTRIPRTFRSIGIALPR